MIDDFSILTHSLPDAIAVGDRSLAIKTDTMHALQAITILGDESVPSLLRTQSALALVLEEVEELSIEEHNNALEGLLDFLRGYPTQGEKSKEPLMDYEIDHALIYSALRQTYGLTLQQVQNLHWWEFQALLQGVPDSTQLGGVIRLRAMDIDPKLPIDQKEKLRKAKASVKIRKKKTKGKLSGFDIVSMGLLEGDKL